MAYTPQPIDTSHVSVDPALAALIEKLARNVHEVWARDRIAEGWTYGSERDEDRKTTPCLVDYDALAESEKDYDRRTALETIKHILSLGYRIEPPAADRAAAGQDALASLVRTLATPSPLALQQLQVIWTGRDPRAWKQCPELYRLLGERLVRLSEPLLAYDVLTEGLECWPRGIDPRLLEDADRRTNVRMRQLLGRALAQGNLPARAGEVFALLRRQGQRDGETTGMLARTCKDLGHWDQALELYSEAYEQAVRAGNPDAALYNGINAASLSLLCGRRGEAACLAHAVAEICHEKIRRQQTGEAAPDYWVEATLGEAALVLGSLDEAAEHYGRAAGQAGGHFGDILSMRRQCRLLLESLGVDGARFERIFPVPQVVLFSGGGGILDGDKEAGFLDRLRGFLACGGTWAGYACPTTPAAVVFLEELLRRGWEIHIALPFSQDHQLRAAREWADGAAWAARLERVLAGAATVHPLGDAADMDPHTCQRFASQCLEGLAILKAQMLETRLHRFAPDSDAVSPAGARPDGCDFPQAIRAMLFADAKGYSRLSERQLALFGQHYLDCIAGVIQTHRASLLAKRTAGDGLFCVFAKAEDALAFALELRDRLATIDWAAMGLPDDVGIRISLDAGPVYSFEDPVMGQPDFTGKAIIRAARIEPVTPPGHVYASEALAALITAGEIQAGRSIRFEYVGRVILPKNYGTIPLYHVERAARQSGSTMGLVQR